MKNWKKLKIVFSEFCNYISWKRFGFSDMWRHFPYLKFNISYCCVTPNMCSSAISTKRISWEIKHRLRTAILFFQGQMVKCWIALDATRRERYLFIVLPLKYQRVIPSFQHIIRTVNDVVCHLQDHYWDNLHLVTEVRLIRFTLTALLIFFTNFVSILRRRVFYQKIKQFHGGQYGKSIGVFISSWTSRKSSAWSWDHRRGSSVSVGESLWKVISFRYLNSFITNEGCLKGF